MPVELKFFLLSVVLTVLVFFLLWRSNIQRNFRYRQVYYPVLAFILSAAAIIFYTKHYTEIHSILIWGTKVFVGIFISPLPPDIEKFGDYAAALVIIIIFLLVKSIKKLLFKLEQAMTRRSKKKNSKTAPQETHPTIIQQNKNFCGEGPGGGGFYKKSSPLAAGGRISAYQLTQNNDIVLREKWEFIYLFLNKFAWLVSGIILISLVTLHLTEFPIETPQITILVLMIVLESAWYLNGPRAAMYRADLRGKEAARETIGDYANLWNEYQERWGNKLLLAHQERVDSSPAIKAEKNQGVFKPEEANYEELTVSGNHLSKQGYTLSSQDYFIMRELYGYNDIIIAESAYNRIAPVIFTSLVRTVMRQYNVLIVVPHGNIQYSSYTQNIKKRTAQWFTELAGGSNIGEINYFTRFDHIHEEDRILIANADDLLEEETINHPWFSNLKTVLFIDVTEVFSRGLTSCSILLNILRKKNQSLQCVVITDYRQAIESSIRRNLDMKGGTEIRVLRDKTPVSHLLVWQLEGPDTFQEKLFAGDIDRYLGAEAILAVLPWRDNLENIFLFNQEKVCWMEYLEELENSKSSLDENKIKTDVILHTQSIDRIKCSPVSYLLEPTRRMILFSRDAESNLVINVTNGNTYAEKEILLHVVSPPYLLREYLVANFKYFYKTPIFALTSRRMVSKFSLALSLMERLILIGLSEEEILEDIHRVKPGATDARNELRDLFKLAFNLDVLSHDFLGIDIRYDFNPGDCAFKQRHIFRLSPAIKRHFHTRTQLGWLKRIKICDQFGNTFDEISMDHVYQNYLPGQIHSFLNKSYRIDHLDESMSILRVSNVNPVNIPFYRLETTVELSHLQLPCLEEYRAAERFNDLDIELELCEASFDIITSGYYFSEGKNLKYKPMEIEDKIRTYNLGRILKINFYQGKAGNLDTAIISSNLALLLKELLVTFFPGIHRYIVVTSGTADKKTLQEHRMLLPQLHDKTVQHEKLKSAKKLNAIKLYLFEDSHQDMGLLQSIFDKWKYIFKVMDDYVAWVLAGHEDKEITGTGKGKDQQKPGIDRYKYLKLFTGQIPGFINLDMVSLFLRKLVGDNDLTKARQGFYMQPGQEQAAVPKNLHSSE